MSRVRRNHPHRTSQTQQKSHQNTRVKGFLIGEEIRHRPRVFAGHHVIEIAAVAAFLHQVPQRRHRQFLGVSSCLLLQAPRQADRVFLLKV